MVNPKGGRIGANVHCTVSAKFERQGPPARKAPFDRNRPRPRANIPQHFARTRSKRRKRKRAHRAFGDLAVAGEQGIVQPSGARQPLARGDGDRDRDRCDNIFQIKALRRGVPNAFARAAQTFQNLQIGCEALRRQPIGQFLGRGCIAQQANCPRTFGKQRTKPCERGRVQTVACHFFQPPAKARGGNRKRRGCGIRLPFARRQLRGQATAGAVPERSARSEDCNIPATAGQNRRDRKRHRPFATAWACTNQLQMPWATKDDFRLRQRGTACI